MLSKSCTQCTLAVSVWLFMETGSCVLSSSAWQISKVASRGLWCQFLGSFLTVGHSSACHQQWESSMCKPVLGAVAQCVCTPRALASPEGCWLSRVFYHPTCPVQHSCPEVKMLCTSAALHRNQWLVLVTSLFLCCECPAFSPPLMVSCRFFSLWCQI